MTVAGGAPLTALVGEPRRTVLRRTWRAWWVGIVPAVLVGLVLRYLVPSAGPGVRGVVALLGQRHLLSLAIGLYFVFGVVARHWFAVVAGPVDARASVRSGGLRGTLVLVAMVTGAAGVAYAVRSWVAQPYGVLSASMLPTLEPGDLVVGRKRPYGSGAPRRGDVVVFRAASVGLGPAGADAPEVLVKRVIGLPGDRVSMRGSTPVINGREVSSCDAGEYFYALPALGDRGVHGRLRVEFLEGHAYLTVYAPGPAFEGTYRVKPGEVFVLGDNRGNSLDSRAYAAGHGGGVPREAIEARVERFLVGRHRDAEADFGRLLRPVDALEGHLRLEGVQTQSMDDAIAHCSRLIPEDTRPPPP